MKFRLPRRIIYDKGYGYIPQYWLFVWHNCKFIVDGDWNVYPLYFETLEEAQNYINDETKEVWRE